MPFYLVPRIIYIIYIQIPVVVFFLLKVKLAVVPNLELYPKDHEAKILF